jgi:TM2 domain-containing membrane protein YozV
MGILGDIVNAFEVPKKSKGSAYAALIFVGLLGWHQFYLGKKLRGVLYVVVFILLMYSWNTTMVPLAYITSLMLLIFFLFDLFTLGKQVDKWNAENAGNALVEAAGSVAGAALSIPLNNAIEEYNGVVSGFETAITIFNEKKAIVEPLLGRLQNARKDTIAVITKMREIIEKIPSKDKELVIDKLGESGGLSTEVVNQVLYGKDELSTSLEQSIDAASQEMTETFNVARDFTQLFESSAGKFAAATAATVIQGLVSYSKQQGKIVELKQGREDILRRQNEIEIKIRQLEATEKRASEILRVIEGEMPGFNHIYDNFCAAVFPDGILNPKEAATLTEEEQKLLMELVQAARQVIAAGSQEIN